MLAGLVGCGQSNKEAETPQRPDSPEWAAELGDEKGADQLFVVAGISQTTAYVSMHEKDESGSWKEIMATAPDQADEIYSRFDVKIVE